MQFIPYGKTKHADDARTVTNFLATFPELRECDFVATEKLDGTNFTLMFEQDGTVRQGSRKRELTLDLTHFDYHNSVLEQYKREISLLRAWSMKHCKTLRIYGELFGRGVLPRIEYGDTKRFLPFQLEKDGVGMSVEEAIDFMYHVVGYEWWVPVIEVFSRLDLALNYDVDSFKDRQIEGVVIEPYNLSRTHPHLGKCKFKLKTKAFCDITSDKQKKPKEKIDLTGKALELAEVFAGFFNTNRLLDLIAKEGPLTEMSQTGYYLRLLCQDAREDLLAAHKETFCCLTDSEKKVILKSGGSLSAPLIKEHIFKHNVEN